MKIGVKTKIIMIGIATLLVLGGIGIILWHNQQPTQAIPESTINQTAQKASAVSPITYKIYFKQKEYI